MTVRCLVLRLLLVGPLATAQLAAGPVPGAGFPHAGWVQDDPDGHNRVRPAVDSDGTLRITGDTRVYLVEDHRKSEWGDHSWVVRLTVRSWCGTQ